MTAGAGLPDQARVQELADKILEALKKNRRAPNTPERVFEALNALAFAAATVAVSTGDRTARRVALSWFSKALTDYVGELTAAAAQL